MSFIRTILGDVPADTAADSLGCCGAHEHVIIDSPHIAAAHPAFLLNSVSAACIDLAAFKAAGGGWLIDTMPTGAGRCAAKLAEASLRSGVAIVCPTGLHLRQYYPADAPELELGREELAALFVREITQGVRDEGTTADAPPVGRAGVIKVAGGRDRLTPHQVEAFAAAAEAARVTGCPVITHTEAGTAGEEQVRLLLEGGAAPQSITLSHTDRVPDVGYHRQLLSAGVNLEYDNHFRVYFKTGECPTATLVAELAEEFPEQICLGMDLARRGYGLGYGGEPGLAWLLRDLPGLLAEAGVTPAQRDRLLKHNPARAFAFARNKEEPCPQPASSA
ncbi:MAG: phosphotriesterase [Phycisphaerae bacterium]